MYKDRFYVVVVIGIIVVVGAVTWLSICEFRTSESWKEEVRALVETESWKRVDDKGVLNQCMDALIDEKALKEPEHCDVFVNDTSSLYIVVSEDYLFIIEDRAGQKDVLWGRDL